ncbi:epoxyqueuosine reductase QueH [Seleniivibrio woodruffii]|uniref:Epoxyqueuosine reductase QueH n=1 Tax=Seleniivibrio woodruffii TaxID=1078050 RepID=A0A4R1K8T5_9BACT|nr:epoxyqueuosine reductase QueH [Seleniivibrio woodruffii]TCK59549.1 hypothetical protein C8D98_2483 [Seleniivibrio woodruffii]TVZ35410.1 hypothetical protein OF66_1025 [Seleniivibrio woodruffii]
MNILLHQCCGPCSIYPVEVLRGMGHSIAGYWFNPNIHPLTEYYRRFETLVKFNRDEKIPFFADDNYGLVEFTRNVANAHNSRCAYCYAVRLEAAAKKASEEGFDAFTSTLFYSRYQNHELMKQTAQNISAKYSIDFFYYDFRTGWQKGIDCSREKDMYRQPYCGCIYSEEDRYRAQISKKINNLLSDN